MSEMALVILLVVTALAIGEWVYNKISELSDE